MSKWTAIIGLAVIPFIAVAGHDIRELQLVMAIGIALVSTLLYVKDNKIGRVSNTPALIFMGYLWLATMLAPKPGLDLAGMDIGYFWAWKPLFFITVMFWFMSSVSSWGSDRYTHKCIIRTITVCAVVMSCLVFLQGVGLDQFFTRDARAMAHDQWNLAGSIGHPSFVGTWLAIATPFTLAFKNRVLCFFSVCAVLCTMSMIAIGSLFVALSVYFALKSKKHFIATMIIGLVIGLGVTFAWVKYPETHKHLTSSGRIDKWVQVVGDIKAPLPGTNAKYPITGRGMGSFYYVFHTEHNNRFYQAHNEYLEIAYNIGIAGTILLLWAIFRTISNGLTGGVTRYRRILVASFVASIVSAGGLFIWQLGPHIYYTAFIAGLLNSNDL